MTNSSGTFSCHCEERLRRRNPVLGAMDCFAPLAMTAMPLIQPFDRHRDTLADADAHGGERELAAALLHAVHGSQRQPRATHAEGMAERDRAAMRVDEIGIVLDAELAQDGDALRGEGL